MPRTKEGEETRNEILAERYLIVMCYGAYQVKMKAHEGPANYAERVARKHGRDGDIGFERVVRSFIDGIKSSSSYIDLRQGYGSAELVLNTLTWYAYVRSCR